ncbi:MAG: type II secretion system F family protein [Kiloniellales bacterium]|nr:type II secretion system F family protein [Kiloniellales bacterium]
MPFDTIYLFYGAVFAGAVFLIEGIYFWISDSKGQDKANRRMNMLAAGQDPTEVFTSLRRKPRTSDSIWGPLAVPFDWYEDLLTKCGMTMTVKRLLFFMTVATLGIFGILLVFLNYSGLPNLLATNAACLFLGILFGWVIPTLILVRKKKVRVNKFGEMLPDTLDTIVRSLHAGHPIAAALALVTKEMPDPVGTEFGIAVDEMTYGQELRQALDNMGDRIGHPDFEYVIVAINIQHETGGNLAEVLSNLSSIIRERFRMFQKIKALSAEGRLSAWVLTALPILTLLGLSVTAPTYYGDVMDDPIFWPVMGTSMALLLLGIFIMWRMVNFRV